jgi:hypothetical protein
MGYTITNNGQDIKITDGVDNSWLFPKDGTMIYHYGDKVRLVNGSVKVDIDYTQVDAPSVASGSALYDALDSYKFGISSSSVISTQAPTVTSTEVLASDGKIGASFVNLSSADCYILLGDGTASATNYTVKLSTGVNSIYELPYGYSGAVQVVFSGTGTGNLVITKLL